MNMAAGPVRIAFAPQQTRLELADGATLTVLPFGPHSLAEGRFRHDLPTPFELEQAIDVIEEALTATRLPQATRGALVTAAPLLLALPGLDRPGASLPRDAVESLFQRLASASLGHPSALAGLANDGEAAAALVILRECMHHLGFDAVQTSADPAAERVSAPEPGA
jgi:exopolyphosphatase/pppGpp-phosphohydrolase